MVNKKKICILMAALFFVWFFGVRQTTTQSFEQTGDIYFAKRDYRRAIVEWSKALGQRLNQKSGQDLDYESERNPGRAGIMGKIGNAYLRLAKFERAEKMFERALEIDPEAVDIHFELARLSLLNGKFASAEQRCTLLKKMVPLDPEVEIIMGDMAVLDNRLERAEKFYRSAMDLSSGSPRSLLKLATCLVMLKKIPEAETLFVIVGKTGLRTPGILVQMADYYLVSGRNEDAEACLVAALEKEPEDLDIKVRLARFYRSTHTLDKAEAVFASLVAEDPANLYFRKMVCDIYISLNKLDAAEQTITDMKKLVQEPDPDFEMLQGKYWLYCSNYVYAGTHFKTATDLAPGFFWAHYFLSVAYLMGGQNQLGENSLENALFFYPDQPQALLLMASIQNKKKNYSLGLDYLKRLRSREPDNSRALRLAGLSYMALGEYEQARVSFSSALLISPDDPGSLYLLGITAEALHMENLARKLYTRVLDNNPKFGDVIHRYAVLLMNQGDGNAVNDLMVRLFEKNRDNPYYYYVAALVDVWAGQLERAEKHFKEVLLSKIPLGEAHVGLADLYLSRGRTKDAVSILEICTTTIPDFEAAWTGLAGIHLKTGKPLRALAVMELAEKKLPESHVILGNLAWLYLETESDLDLALDFARKAYEKCPDNPAITDTLAWAYCKKKAFAQAVWLLAAVEADDPENGMVLYHQGMALYGLGKVSEAVDKLKQAARTELEEPVLIRIKEVLAQVTGPEDEQPINPMSAADDNFDFNSFELEKSPFEDLQKSIHSEDMLEPHWQ